MQQGLRSVRSYALYYGMGGEDVLSHYDLAVVDPGGRTPDGVEAIKERGTIALGYVSVLEVPRLAGVAAPPNVLRWQGQLQVQQEFNNWVLDPRAPLTRNRFLRVVESVLQQGYQGIFLDCVSNVEDRNLPVEFRNELVPATAWLVAEVVRQFPSCLVVQNWGLHYLLPMTGQYLDAVCWEDFPFSEIGPIPSVHSGIRKLNAMQEQVGLRVLALNQNIDDPVMSHVARAAAERCGFLWYGTTRYIDLPQQ